jgi:microcystin-dependent protein
MATVTGFTADRMIEIENSSVVDGEIRGDGHLWLIQHDGTEIDAGPVTGPPGPVGPVGPASISAIPGEVKLWPGGTLPNEVTYGKWVWADGAVYVVASYPIAAGHIATEWRTFGGASDPGGANFRVPDLRGLVPAGMDNMPGGSARANRMTRSVAIILAGRTGEETHIISFSEMPVHNHGIDVFAHSYGGGALATQDFASTPNVANATSTRNAGGGIAHENVQPTVFVPYIVKLDD